MTELSPALQAHAETILPAAEACIDFRAQEEARAILGAKFPVFVQTYIEDTEARLSAIGRLMGGENAAKSIALHAHSIMSSSAYVGAFRLVDSAGRLETKAMEIDGSPAALVVLWAEMRGVFAVTKHLLINDDIRGKTAS